MYPVSHSMRRIAGGVLNFFFFRLTISLFLVSFHFSSIYNLPVFFFFVILINSYANFCCFTTIEFLFFLFFHQSFARIICRIYWSKACGRRKFTRRLEQTENALTISGTLESVEIKTNIIWNFYNVHVCLWRLLTVCYCTMRLRVAISLFCWYRTESWDAHLNDVDSVLAIAVVRFTVLRKNWMQSKNLQ